MATTEKKYLSYEQLTYYDGKIKKVVTDGDAATLASAKSYADGLADNYEAAGSVATLANGQVKTNKESIETLNGADTVEGSVAKQIKDAKTALTTEIDKKATKATTLSGYGITDAYTKAETDSAIATEIANAEHLKREIVETLPAVASANAHTIYMVAKTSGAGDQQYDEYMLINGAIEKIGDSAVDLTNYATKTEVSTAKSEAISTAAGDATGKANQALEDAKAYADGLAGNYATAAQGTKADSALQKADITSGTTNGTISVDGSDVSVKGLASAAYKTAGSESGNVPVNGAALGTTANVPVVTNASGQIVPHASGALGTAAFTASTAYATSAQGAKADSAIQSVASGTTNGTVSVDGTDVAVKGLGTAAYAATSAFDPAGSASAVQTAFDTYKSTNDAAVQANANDIDTLEGKVATLESVTYVEITNAEIDALFA